MSGYCFKNCVGKSFFTLTNKLDLNEMLISYEFSLFVVKVPVLWFPLYKGHIIELILSAYQLSHVKFVFQYAHTAHILKFVLFMAMDIMVTNPHVNVHMNIMKILLVHVYTLLQVYMFAMLMKKSDILNSGFVNKRIVPFGPRHEKTCL